MTWQLNSSQGRGHDCLPSWNPKNGGILVSQPVTSCLTNHSEFCMSRLLNMQWRWISMYRLKRRPSFGFESSVSSTLLRSNVIAPVKTRMWANAQRDGRPAEYRWRPLFNAAKFGWRPLLQCRAVTLRRPETCWNLQGCPKLTKRSQPLVGRSSPYYGDMWRRYCC